MPKHIFSDTIVLGSGHSLLLGHKPKNLELKSVNKKVEEDAQDVDSFGLFDSSSPNYTTYYPDVKAEDLKPKDAEFIFPTFRMLSETVVHRRFNPIDFAMNNALRNSMNLLMGQTVNVDHETALGNAIGTVKEVLWQDSYKTKSGDIIPAGINAVLMIDGKSNPRIARGIMMDPPSIHSNSVTVSFNWEKSHPNMDSDSFWEKLGTYEKDGQLIRRVVTEVTAYHETSLVAHGADPFAQIIKKNGEINNPKYASTQSSLSAEDKKSGKFYLMDFKDKTQLSQNPLINKQKDTHMKELIQSLAAVVALTSAEEITEAMLTDHIKNMVSELAVLKTDKTKLTSDLETANNAKTDAEAKVTALSTDKTNLENEVVQLKKLETIANSTLTELKSEAERLYGLVSDGKTDEKILDVIKNADFDTAKALVKQYDSQVSEKFVAKCSDCNSTNVTTASAKIIGEGSGGNTNKSNTEVVTGLRNKHKAGSSRLHIKTK